MSFSLGKSSWRLPSVESTTERKGRKVIRGYARQGRECQGGVLSRHASANPFDSVNATGRFQENGAKSEYTTILLTGLNNMCELYQSKRLENERETAECHSI